MRPKRLKMLGIGPYATEVDIDFTRLNEEGLFLITGATGAGKTSIFDGITYALFGKTNFDDTEKKNGIICDYITEGEKSKAYVEYEFELDGVEYRVRRTPAYEYINRNGKLSKKSESAEIEYGDKIKTKKSEVDKFIEKDVIKLEYSQFKKIIMLAQGSFSEFIKSNSTDKSKILRQIFDTDIYERVSERLKLKSEGIRGDISTKKRNIFARLGTLEIEDPVWKEMVVKENLDYDRLSEIIEGEKESINNLIEKGEAEKKQHNIEAVTERIATGRLINGNIDKLNLAKVKQEELLREEKTFEEKKEKIKRYDRAMEISGEYKVYEGTGKTLTERTAQYEAEDEKLKALKEANREEISRLEEYEERVSGLKSSISRMETLKGDIEIYRENKRALEINGNKIEADEGELDKNRDRFKNTEERIEVLKKSQERIKGELDERQKESKRRDDLEKKQLQLKPILTEIKNIAAREEEAEKKEKKLHSFMEETQEKLSLYRNLYNMWFQGEAYKLSVKLVEGEPCPVCGSMEHPKKAEKPEGAPTEEELNRSKAEYERCNDLFNTSKGELENLRNSIGALKEKVTAQAVENKFPEDWEALVKFDGEIKEGIGASQKRLEGLSTEKDLIDIQDRIGRETDEQKRLEAERGRLVTNIEVLRSQLVNSKKAIEDTQKKFAENNISIEGYEEELSRVQGQVKETVETIQRIVRMRDEITKKTTQLSSLKVDIDRLKEVLKEQGTKWNKRLTENSFADMKDYREALAIDVRRLKVEIDEHVRRLTEVQTIIKDNSKYEKAERVEMEVLEEKKREISQKIEELDRVINKNKSRLNTFAKPEEELKASRGFLEEKEKEYRVYSKLYDLSVGKYGDKKNNITFQNYVLAVYFQDVLDRANDRLLTMTNNQYRMMLDSAKKGNAGSGLEVNVFDSHTGKERSIKTLSGGETFKASMALALGLSDVVQSQNGGIKLDSVFIDEGFGTLDEESLSVAMDILVELKSSGRTVGIISHVNELKQTITSQIRVVKTVRGSSVEVVV
ncbi:nuclease SbcCD subunit C [Propionigenium maris DSM 9537]|uniref:Nuclease SbcCD subunit C n=1 Tax=Propionigenium maris DSM 9537 TaxID=1123000 RepID=A0A9W6LP95_9FUSO|nr:SMC family ATPase [Propionigenium maris]GLI58156.1 nuclease SbcCD subunit C [Propionigenium maris DSM 9537]